MSTVLFAVTIPGIHWTSAILLKIGAVLADMVWSFERVAQGM
jgi:hypothetical protein